MEDLVKVRVEMIVTCEGKVDTLVTEDEMPRDAYVQVLNDMLNAQAEFEEIQRISAAVDAMIEEGDKEEEETE